MSVRSFWGSIGALLGVVVASVTLADPLLDAAAIGNLAEVQQQLEHGADVNVMDEDKFRPLHWAAFGGYTEMVELLIDNGAEIDVKNDDGLTPLHSAVLAGHTDVVRRLLELGADAQINTRDGNTAREMAIIRGRESLVKVFDEPYASAAGPPSNDDIQASDDIQATAEGKFVIQLAALRSEPAAEQTWKRYQQSFPALLGNSPLLLQRVELADRGTFYRIRTGPFPNRGHAETLCQRLKSQKQSCLVVAK